jgi:hypothetical protein
VTASFVAGFTLLLAALLPTELIRRIPVLERRPVWLLMTALVTVAVVAQWGWATYHAQNIWVRTALEQAPLKQAFYSRPVLHAATRLANFYDTLTPSFQVYPIFFLGSGSALLPLLGLVGLVGVLRGASSGVRTPFWGARRQWIGRVLAFLFAVFVVGYGGEALGISLPLALVLALALLRLACSPRLAQASTWVDHHNAGATDEEPLIRTRRRELLTRAKALADVAQQRAAAFAKYEPVAGDSDAYFAAVGALDAEAIRLERGGPGPADLHPVPDGQPNRLVDRPDLLALPEGLGPGELAFGLGPAAQWWDNGMAAVRLGSRLAWLPIAYFVYVLLTVQSSGLLTTPTPFAAVTFFAALASEATFWLTAAFTLGCLFPYLRGRNGLVKGAALAGVYFAAQAGASLIGARGDAFWLVRAFQLLLFLMLLGAWLDATTVAHEGLSWRYLLGRYEVLKVKTLLTYAPPLIGVATVIVQQLLSNDAAKAIVTIATDKTLLPTLLSSFPQ